MSEAARYSASRGQRRALLAAGMVVVVVALVARLVPMLAGGGLYGLGNYDDAVYYAAASGLIRGVLPYQDFLLLHPPGVVVVLAPFAALGTVIGDANGLAVARVSWAALGALNSVLAMAYLKPRGWVGAVVAGLGYAVFYPAVYNEHTVLLEGLGATFLLAALLVAKPDTAGRGVSGIALAVCGALLGVGSAVKIWGVVAVALVAAWYLRQGIRRALPVLAGAATAVTAVCAPFFLLAPAAMWRQVVEDQLDRPRRGFQLWQRVGDMLGLHLYDLPDRFGWQVGLALTVVLAAMVLAWAGAVRLPVLLLVCFAGVLASTPVWFLHYAGLLGVPVALILGGAAQTAANAVSRWGTRMPAAVVALLFTTGLLAYATPLASDTTGERFPGRQLAAAVKPLPGCVTSDDVTTLIQMNVFSRNLERGCPLMLDMGGHSYDLPNPEDSIRRKNPRWQEFSLRYLSSGSATITSRFSRQPGFSKKTVRAIERWPVLAQAGEFVLRAPQVHPVGGR
jgi:alpha-1,2-mannosyltransferase